MTTGCLDSPVLSSFRGGSLIEAELLPWALRPAAARNGDVGGLFAGTDEPVACCIDEVDATGTLALEVDARGVSTWIGTMGISVRSL